MLPEREADVSAGERERRRKGKGTMPGAGRGANQAGRTLRVSEYNSGSDSWDPINAGAHIANEDSSFSSKDADSRAFAEARQAGGPNLPSNDEDMDLGGEGGGGERGVTSGEKDMRQEKGGSREAAIQKEEDTMKVTKEDASKTQEGKIKAVRPQAGEKTVIVISDDSNEEAPKGKVALAAGSIGSTASVPPGFQRIHGARQSPHGGSSSPFGKLQKGDSTFSNGHHQRPRQGRGRVQRRWGRKVSQSPPCPTRPSRMSLETWGLLNSSHRNT